MIATDRSLSVSISNFSAKGLVCEGWDTCMNYFTFNLRAYSGVGVQVVARKARKV